LLLRGVDGIHKLMFKEGKQTTTLSDQSMSCRPNIDKNCHFVVDVEALEQVFSLRVLSFISARHYSNSSYVYVIIFRG
jgi:hypothetical protein